MNRWDDRDVVPSVELLERTVDDHDEAAWAGITCSRGCRGPQPCEHVAHLVAALERGGGELR